MESWQEAAPEIADTEATRAYRKLKKKFSPLLFGYVSKNPKQKSNI